MAPNIIILTARHQPAFAGNPRGTTISLARPTTLGEALLAAAKCFPALARQGQLYLERNAYFGMDHVEVTESAWATETGSAEKLHMTFDVCIDTSKASCLTPELEVKEEASLPLKRLRCTSTDLEPSMELASTKRSRVEEQLPTPPPPGTVRVRVWAGYAEGELADVTFTAKPSTRLGKILNAYMKITGRDDVRLFDPDGDVARPEEPLSIHIDPDHKAEVEKIIFTVRLEQKGGKPVIYLFAPINRTLPKVDVSLTLTPSWRFSALYPVTPIVSGKNGTTSTSWIVSADSESNLVEHETGLEATYLFWEALTTGFSSPPSPPLLPIDTETAIPSFDPSFACITPSNGADLPLAEFLPYLSATLKALTLHTSARTDFVTYWLPHFNRIAEQGQRIAFRFLSQKEYEPSARLEVQPKPDVVTRIFLLFKGVGEDEEWGKAAKAQDFDWLDIVGIEQEMARDVTKFRVLEWGGMEIKC